MVFKVATNTVIASDRSFRIQANTTGTRPVTPEVGMIRYNTTLGEFEIRSSTGWGIVRSVYSNAWTWGNGALFDATPTGALGLNSNVAQIRSPAPVAGYFSDWKGINAGGFYTMAGVRANGTAWGWGYDSLGSVGDGTVLTRFSPVSVVGGFTDWIQISKGSQHTAALRANGTIWSWGSGSDGKLGNNSTTQRSSPVSVVGGITDWKQVNAGTYHTTAIRANGTAWAWGRNVYGQLGDNSTTGRSSPVSVVGGFTDWVQIDGGSRHTAGIRANGTAWAWGSGGNGRLGDNTGVGKSSPVSVVGGFTDWAQISAGRYHTAAVRANGTAWAWGYGSVGRLGDGTTSTRSSPVSVVGGFTDWVQISAGSSHSLAVRANGTAWGWGDNFYGEIGDNTITARSSPVSVVGGFTDWILVSAGFDASAGLRA